MEGDGREEGEPGYKNTFPIVEQDPRRKVRFRKTLLFGGFQGEAELGSHCLNLLPGLAVPD